MGAGLLLAGAVMPCTGWGAEPDWFRETGGGWKSKASALDSELLVSVDGRVINPVKSKQPSGNTSATPENASGESAIKSTVNNIAVSHETQLDSKRNALRILDVLTNNDSKERSVRVEFRTQMRSNNKLKYNGFIADGGEVLENGNSVPEQTHAIILLAELPDSPALPLFVWGDRDAAWPVSIHEVTSSVSLGYEGVIKPGEKVALVHWVATAGLDKAIKLERTFDLFLKDGKLVDPMIPEDVRPYVVNFKPDSLIQNEAPPVIARKNLRLVALDRLCEKLSLKREDKDILWLSKDEVFKGTVATEKLSFSMGDRAWEIDWKDVAAIRGGGGRGTEHRLFLRNGSVWDGRVKFSEAKLLGDIGTMTLNAEALVLLVCRRQPDDGRPVDGEHGIVQTLNGRHFWVNTNEVFATKLVSRFGVLSLEAVDVWLVKRKTELPFDHTVTLMDGSRIQGVLADSLLKVEVPEMGPQSFSFSELARWGKRQACMQDMEAADEEKTKAATPTRYCWLRDGSFLVGTLTEASVVIRTRQEDITLKSQEIARLAPVESDSGLMTVELHNGTKIKGRLLQGSVSWQLGKQVVNLPVGLITELVRKDKP